MTLHSRTGSWSVMIRVVIRKSILTYVSICPDKISQDKSERSWLVLEFVVFAIVMTVKGTEMHTGCHTSGQRMTRDEVNCTSVCCSQQKDFKNNLVLRNECISFGLAFFQLLVLKEARSPRLAGVPRCWRAAETLFGRLPQPVSTGTNTSKYLVSTSTMINTMISTMICKHLLVSGATQCDAWNHDSLVSPSINFSTWNDETTIEINVL